MTDPCLSIAYSAEGGRARVTARLAGKPIYADLFDPSVAAKRRDFSQELHRLMPAADPAVVESELLGIADALAASRAKPQSGGDNAGANHQAGEAPPADAELVAEVDEMLSSPDLLTRLLDDIKNARGPRRSTSYPRQTHRRHRPGAE